jgi:hypothetical protein
VASVTKLIDTDINIEILTIKQIKMKLKLLALLITTAIFTSCQDGNSNKQKELELKERELSLKEKELALKEKETTTQTVVPMTPVEKPNQIETSVPVEKPISSGINQLSNIENLIGNWFMPKNATVNIKFDRNGRFEFNDYNSTLEKEELLTGEFHLENGTLSLLYDDRPKQRFRFYKGTEGDKNYYIRKGEYYFVKGEN